TSGQARAVSRTAPPTGRLPTCLTTTSAAPMVATRRSATPVLRLATAHATPTISVAASATAPTSRPVRRRLPDKLLIASRHAAGIESFRVEVSGDLAVAQDEDAPAMDGRGRLVGDHDDGQLLLRREPRKEGPELFGRARV